MAAEFFAEAGLTEQELALVSDAVQQVLAEHDSSALPGDLAAALASSQQQTRPSAVPVLEPQQHQQYVHQPAAVGTSTGEGYEIVLPDAGVAGLSSMSEIMAAEQVGCKLRCTVTAYSKYAAKHIAQLLVELNSMCTGPG